MKKENNPDYRPDTAIANYFISTCAMAYCCDLETGEVRVLKVENPRKSKVTPDLLVLDKGVDFYVNRYVHPDDRPRLLEWLGLEYIRNALRKSESYSFNYKELHGGRERMYRAVIMRGDDEKQAVAMFTNITDSFHKEVERIEIENTYKALNENKNRMMALEDKFESLYDVELESGEYSQYIKGRTSYSEINDMFVEHDEFFADTDVNVRRVVYPEDVEGVLSVLDKENIKKVLNNNNHFDWYYRLIVDGSPMWFRMRIVYKNEERKNVIIGIFNAEDEVLTKQRDEKLRNELINRMISDDGLFLIDCKRDTRRTIHDNCYGADFFSDHEPYSDAIAKYIDMYVLESDREMMREVTSRQYMLERLKNEDEYSIEYRDTSIGMQRFYQMRVAKFSDTEVLQGFSEKDKEIVDRLVFNKLENEYFALYVVDIDAEMIRIVKDSAHYSAVTGGTAAPYTPTMKKFASELEGDAKAFFIKIANLEFVKEKLKDEDKHTFSYKSPILPDKNWVDMTSFVILRHDDGSPAMFTLGFGLADSFRADRQELQSRMKEDMKMIGGLASGYHALYYFDMEERVFKIYSIDGKRVNELKKFVSDDGDPVEMMLKFGLSELVYPDDRHLFENMNVEKVREKLAHKKRFSIRFRRNVDGQYLWTEMDVLKYEDVDARANTIAIGFAVRDEEIRNELKQQEQLEEALRAAEIANRSKTSFLFSMSHDIRTPLNAITGFTTMAKKYIDDRDKVKEYLNKIDISGHQLLTLINQVLEMSRIDSGKIEFAEEPVNISERFNSLVTLLAEQAKTQGLKFRYTLKGIKHYNVFSDEARISSITLNVAGNAMKYTPEGGTITYNFKEIDCDREGYARYVLTVADTGIGMSEEYLKNLFEPFSREKNSTVSRIQGTGLGMSIVKSLVDLMGGKIEVRSKPGKGTRFDITLDFRINENADAETPKVVNVGKLSFAGHRILLVEDNEMNREIAKNILEESGFEVDEAEDGDVAVAKVKAVIDRGEPGYYNGILMDVQMPRMNGYEATREIRKLLPSKGKHIPIIAMTANAFEEDRQDALKAGMDEHLAKPIELQKFYETLVRFLS